jgi:hypothetical protein
MKDNTMDILKMMNEGYLMDSYEKYYIHEYSKMGVSLNEQHVFLPSCSIYYTNKAGRLASLTN